MNQFTTEAGHDGPVALGAAGTATLRPVPRGRVRVTANGFFGDWQKSNGESTIPHCITQLEASGAIDNFRRLVGESTAPYRGPVFADSDVYKVLEAIAWEVARTGTNEFTTFVDDAIRIIGSAQAPDGYLNTWVQGTAAVEMLTSMRWSHELYCLGHLIQAAIAWNRATGRTDLLGIALRFVEFVDAELGGGGGRSVVDGHPVIEAALVELWRTTGDARHLELARRLLDARGYRTVGEDRFGYEYFQDHLPIRESTEAVGHAVRQLYLAIGATDILLEEDDPELDRALTRIWDSAHSQKMYITGGMGSRHRDESFGDPFELPPDRAYSETCAAVADFMWNWRLLLLTGRSRFADEMERLIYNVIAASSSLSGTEFFYANPLQLRPGHRSEENAPAGRLPWYTCACCPPNVARLVASMESYMATTDATGVQLHLYGDLDVMTEDGSMIRVRTDYPWSGEVAIEVDQPLSVALRLRVPGWASGQSVRIDGAKAAIEATDGYITIPAGAFLASVELQFDLLPTAETAHPHVDALRGTIAVRRGPVVYCLEQADLPSGVSAEDVYIPARPQMRATASTDLGVPSVVIEGAVARKLLDPSLYAERPHAFQEQELDGVTLVPYFRWGNRQAGSMRVFLPTRSEAISDRPPQQ